MTSVDTILVQMANIDLNIGMFLGGYQIVSGRAATNFDIRSISQDNQTDDSKKQEKKTLPRTYSPVNFPSSLCILW